jgi:hypothetical protein
MLCDDADGEEWMRRLFTRVCVAALLLGASGCLAAFRVGSPQPEIALSPGQAVPASIGIDVNIRADASDEALGHAEAWKQKVWEGAEQSGAFGAVHRSARPDELRAEIDVYVTRTWSNTIGGLLTLFILPAVQRTDLRMITTVVRPDGTRLAPLTETGAYRVWIGWVFIPIPGSEEDVLRDLLVELSRRSLARAAEIERGAALSPR